MEVGVLVVSVSVLAFLAFLLLGGPMLLTDWVRARRWAVIARQIVLTDALDAQFGALVAPVVRKPLFGPWEVWMTAPLLGSDVLARILAVTDTVFDSFEGKAPMRYRMVLRVTPTSWHAVPDRRAPRSGERWAGTPAAA